MTKDLGKIITAIREFDTYESTLHHDQVDIRIPSGFHRYNSVTQVTDKQWDSVDVSLTYYHRELNFSINLTERSQTPTFTIVEYRRRNEECITEYRVAERVSLSIRDVKQFLIFLQKYFRCFYFSISTKLSK
jgi:hypothetical protein